MSISLLTLRIILLHIQVQHRSCTAQHMGAQGTRVQHSLSGQDTCEAGGAAAAHPGADVHLTCAGELMRLAWPHVCRIYVLHIIVFSWEQVHTSALSSDTHPGHRQMTL